MQERMRTTVAEYEAAKFTGSNVSGIHPIGDRVLVMPDIVAEKTSGGIIKPQTTAHVETLAAESGTVVAVGDGAFVWNSDRTRQFVGRKPVPGDRVCFKRYAYVRQIGDDGIEYWIMSDDVIGGIRETKTKAAKAA